LTAEYVKEHEWPPAIQLSRIALDAGDGTQKPRLKELG
jgi:hypothetical protein